MDFEIPVLSKRKADFLSHGITVWVSDYEMVRTCLNKEKCSAFCKENGINMPDFWKNPPRMKERYPIIKKKILGSGSVGQRVLEHPFEGEEKNDNNEFIYQAMIEGTEYGLDVFNDLEGNYIHSYYREKILMRAGETDKARSFYSSKFEELSKEISKVFHHVGNMDIDLIISPEGEYYFIDFNPRFGGGYPFTHLSGFNYLKALIDITLQRKPEFPEPGKSITGMKGIELFFY